MTLKQKVILSVIGCMLIASIVTVGIVIRSIQHQAATQVAAAEKMLLQEKTLSLKAMTDSAIALLDNGFPDQPEESRRDLAVEALSKLRYANGAGYFFAYQKVENGSYVFGFHATKPQLNGQAAKLDGGDAKEFAFRQALVDTAHAGGGVVEYYYENPKNKQVMRKMAYAQLYEPWDWVIVTGIYIDDAEKSLNQIQGVIRKNTNRMMIHLGWVLAIVYTLSLAGLFWVIHSSLHPLAGIIDRLNAGVHEVDGASSQVASVSQSLAEGAAEQAAGIQQTSASLNEISGRIKIITSEMQTVSDHMKQVLDSVHQGSDTSGKARTTMDSIKHAAEETSKIIKTIDEVAFQTNLLALNASVEAARAGEAGRGFAVVAEEVRNLAGRSSESSRDTATLIGESVQSANQGADVIQTLTEGFETIQRVSESAASLLTEVFNNFTDQMSGVSQIESSMNEMDSVVNNNAASAEEAASAAEELSAQAEEMQHAVLDLQILINGRKHFPRDDDRAAD